MTYITVADKIKISEGYTFDDVLLLPNYADFTRDEVDLSVRLHHKILLNLPLLSSPMDTVTMSEMAISISKKGGLGVIHRNLSIEKQVEEINKVKSAEGGSLIKSSIDLKGRFLVAAGVGTGPDINDRIKALVEAEVDLICIDSAHGHTNYMLESVQKVKENYPDLPVMAGNVATRDGAEALITAGADILRVGIGPGSICTTRVVTGVGVPQLTAVNEVASIAKEKGVKIVADGGIKQIGDMSKALAFGADAVMVGSLLAGFNQSPGQTIEIDGNKFKSYRGMGSISAMQEGSASRYGQKMDPKKMVAEGVEGIVKYKGNVNDYLNQVEGGLRGSLFYTGNKNLNKFYENSRFVKITGSGLMESHPHSILIQNSGESYNLNR